jgi:beta-galactosidase/beta-glucuronidase
MNLNNDWRYDKTFHEEMLQNSYDESAMEAVRLPHTNVETPFHYFDEKIYQFVSCYRKHIGVKDEWKGKRILLTFEGVGHVARVYFNENLVTTHYGGYTAFTADLTPYARFKETACSNTNSQETESPNDNVLVVEVDSREDQNLPPFGNVIDYLTYGGIYREVYLDIKDEVYIEDAFVMTSDAEKPGDTQIHNNLRTEPECQAQQVEFQVTLNTKPDQELLLKYKIVKDTDSKNCQAQEKSEIPAAILEGSTKITQKVTNFMETVFGAENWISTTPVSMN